MGFINPLLLYGLAFLAVPILIQFFVNRRRVVLHWAAFEWMKRALEQRRKRVRVDELLKLLSKLLLILALVLFVARPVRMLKGQNKTLIVVDRTLSMATRVNDRDRLAVARDLAGKLIEQTDGLFSLYSFDGDLSPVSSWQESKTALVGLLNTLAVAPRAATARDLLDALVRSDAAREAQTIVFFGDLQKRGFLDRETAAAFVPRLGKEKRVVFVPVDLREGVENCSVSGGRSGPEGFFTGRENELLVTVKNHATSPVAGLPVTLAVGGKDQDRVMVSLGPGEAKEVSLRYAVAEARRQDLLVSLPPDGLLLDNELHVVLEPRPRLNVVAIVGEKGDRPFDLDVFFRSAMLATGARETWSYRSVTASQALDEDFGDVDLAAVFGDPPQAQDNLAAVLQNYLKRQAGLLAFSDGTAPAFWQIFGLTFAAPVETAAKIAPEGIESTYLGFMASGGLDPTQIGFFRFCPIASTNAAESRLRVAGQAQPLIVSRPFGRGRVIGAGFLPYPGFTDLYYNPNFVQFCVRMIWEGLNWNPFVALDDGDIERLPVPGLDAENTYALAADAGLTQELSVREVEGRPTLSGAVSLTSGFYTLTENGLPKVRFGCDVTRADSDIQAVPATAFDNTGITCVTDGQFKTTRSRRELTPWFLALLTGALLLEQYAHFMRRK